MQFSTLLGLAALAAALLSGLSHLGFLEHLKQQVFQSIEKNSVQKTGRSS